MRKVHPPAAVKDLPSLLLLPTPLPAQIKNADNEEIKNDAEGIWTLRGPLSPLHERCVDGDPFLPLPTRRRTPGTAVRSVL